MQGLALGTRHIIDAIQNKCDLKIDELVITGGLSKSSLFNQINANANQVLKNGNYQKISAIWEQK